MRRSGITYISDIEKLTKMIYCEIQSPCYCDRSDLPVYHLCIEHVIEYIWINQWVNDIKDIPRTVLLIIAKLVEQSGAPYLS